MTITPKQVQKCIENAKEMGMDMTEQEAVRFLQKVEELLPTPNPGKGED